jgi:hypothetical protein
MEEMVKMEMEMVEVEMEMVVEMLLEEISRRWDTNPTEKYSLVSGQYLLDTRSNNVYSHLRIVVGKHCNYPVIHQECTA